MMILVLEDDADLREAICELLQVRGHDVRTTLLGAEALRWVREGYRPDAAVLDIGLPDIDGWSVAGALKEMHPACRIFICTGWSEEQERMTCAVGVIEGFLLKPFDVGRFLEALGG